MRLRRRGRADHASLGRLALFAAGLGAHRSLPLVSPLDAVGDRYLLSAHMLQHVLIGDAGPALILLVAARAAALLRAAAAAPAPARPQPPGPAGGRLAAAAPGRARRLGARLRRLAHPRGLRLRGRPTSPSTTSSTRASSLAGFLVWSLLVDPAGHGRLSRGRRLAIAAGVFAMGTVIADVLIFSLHPLYPVYAGQAERVFGLSPLRDQQLAGLVMIVEQMLTLGTFAAVMLVPALRARRRRRRARLRARSASRERPPTGSASSRSSWCSRSWRPRPTCERVRRGSARGAAESRASAGCSARRRARRAAAQLAARDALGPLPAAHAPAPERADRRLGAAAPHPRADARRCARRLGRGRRPAVRTADAAGRRAAGLAGRLVRRPRPAVLRLGAARRLAAQHRAPAALCAGLLFWWPVFERPRRIEPLGVLAYLGLAFISAPWLSLAYIFSSKPFYSFYAHAPRLWGLSAVTRPEPGRDPDERRPDEHLLRGLRLVPAASVLAEEEEEQRRKDAIFLQTYLDGSSEARSSSPARPDTRIRK